MTHPKHRSTEDQPFLNTYIYSQFKKVDLRLICVFGVSCYNFTEFYEFFLSGNDTCVQKTEDGHCCQLPFVYKGETYHSCTKVGSGVAGIGTYFWCFYDQDNEKHDECESKQIH